jgi:hypothetical protein
MHAKACHWPDGEWESSTCCHMHGRECPELMLPDRALYLPTFSHLSIVNKLRGREGRGKRERARERERD